MQTSAAQLAWSHLWLSNLGTAPRVTIRRRRGRSRKGVMRMWCAPHLPRALITQLLRVQYFTQATSDTRRACTGPAPDRPMNAEGRMQNAESHIKRAIKAPTKPPRCVPRPTGVRPSPGAASSDLSGTLESSRNPLLSDNAAPGDGRTPAQGGFPVDGAREMRLGRKVESGAKKRVAFLRRTWHITRLT